MVTGLPCHPTPWQLLSLRTLSLLFPSSSNYHHPQTDPGKGQVLFEACIPYPASRNSGDLPLLLIPRWDCLLRCQGFYKGALPSSGLNTQQTNCHNLWQMQGDGPAGLAHRGSTHPARVSGRPHSTPPASVPQDPGHTLSRPQHPAG